MHQDCLGEEAQSNFNVGYTTGTVKCMKVVMLQGLGSLEEEVRGECHPQRNLKDL